MHRILIIEDSRSTARMMQQAIRDQLELSADIAMNMTEAEALIQPNPSAYTIVLCDLNLPDAPNGEAMDMVLGFRLPCVVVSASISGALRRKLLHTPICDYVVKRGPRDIIYLLSVVKRLIRNEHVTVLVVDDSTSYRNNIVDLLSRQRLQVLEAENGAQALEILAAHPEISLIITDYIMPVMDGFQLTETIRKEHTPDELAIIVTTGQEEDLAGLFLRTGANDFLPKTASFEELICRINMNLNLQDLIKLTRDLSERDTLTGLFNRRMLFQSGHKLLTHSTADIPVQVAMLDIDFFKKVNDTYGHAGGDEALRLMGRLIQEHFPAPCVTARYGGEEFCILFPASTPSNDIFNQLEAFRITVSQAVVTSRNAPFGFTVSIGLARHMGDSLDEILVRADNMLYEAKRTGRNKVVSTAQ